MMKTRTKRGLTAAFQVHTIDAVVQPTGCVVKDRDGQRWQRMRIRVGRDSPDHDWFRIEASRADIKHQLENREFDANSRYVRPISADDFAALMHREVVPFHGAVDQPEIANG